MQRGQAIKSCLKTLCGGGRLFFQGATWGTGQASDTWVLPIMDSWDHFSLLDLDRLGLRSVSMSRPPNKKWTSRKCRSQCVCNSSKHQRVISCFWVLPLSNDCNLWPLLMELRCHYGKSKKLRVKACRVVDQEHGGRFLKAERLQGNFCGWAFFGIAAGIQSAGGKGYGPGTFKAIESAARTPQ